MPPTAALDLSSLSHYKRSIILPTTSRNPLVAKLLTRYHWSTKHSEQATMCLQLANHYFTTELFRHALPYYAASLSHTVQCTHQHDVFPVLTLLRRLGECHQQLSHHSSAANSFQTALTLLARLCPAGHTTKKHWTLKQELLLSLGNAYQDWCDAEDEKGYTAGRPLALKAKDAHYESLLVARRLCGMDKGVVADGAEDGGVREKAITNMQATVLARAYINLANTLTQLLHFDNVEREARKRVAAASAHIDTTDSSSSSSLSLDDNHESSLASTLSSLATLSLASPSASVSLSSLAASLYSSALSLAISHSLTEEEQRVYSNRATLWEEDGQWQEAEDDIKRELKLTRKRKPKSTHANKHNKHSTPHTADIVEQAACKARLMTLAVRAGRYEQAVKEAKERRRLVLDGAEGEEREEEVERAEEEVELMEEIRHNVRVKQSTQRLLEEMEDDMDDRAHKRRRVDSHVGGSVQAEVEVDRVVVEHIQLLHRYIDVCLSLAERNVDCHNNYAAALTAHQHAIALLPPLQPSTTTGTDATLTLSVHSYYLYTITRYLPWLLPHQHSPHEVQQWLTTGHTTLATCQPLARAADRGLLALLECHLMEESGVACDELLRVLHGSMECVERESGGMIVRGQLLREQWHVLDVMDEEDNDDEQQQSDDTKQRVTGIDGGSVDSDSEVRRKARRARRKVQRTLLKGQMEVMQRWAARYEEEADKQRRWLKYGLWMLDDGQEQAVQQSVNVVAESGKSRKGHMMEQSIDEVIE